jgi:hypothetical protein
MTIDLVKKGEVGDGELLTFDDTVGGVGPTASKIKVKNVKANTMQFKLEDAEIRFKIDGTAPTASEGTKAVVDELVTLRGENAIANFKGIRTGATSGKGYVYYYP